MKTQLAAACCAALFAALPLAAQPQYPWIEADALSLGPYLVPTTAQRILDATVLVAAAADVISCDATQCELDVDPWTTHNGHSGGIPLCDPNGPFAQQPTTGE